MQTLSTEFVDDPTELVTTEQLDRMDDEPWRKPSRYRLPEPEDKKEALFRKRKRAARRNLYVALERFFKYEGTKEEALEAVGFMDFHQSMPEEDEPRAA